MLIQSVRGIALSAGFLLVGMPGGTVVAQDDAGGAEGGPVEIAIAIDTSGTMDRLLDAARVDIWDVVARLASEEPTATLRVAVLTYGNHHAGEQAGWVRIEAPLASDLDLVSSRLFAAKISGDTEYVARVVRTAAQELDWDDADETRRILFVLGNESAAQDPLVSLEESLRIAKNRGLEVVPIYCGDPVGNDSASWNRLALLAGSSLAFLDPAKGARAVETPFDKDLGALGDALSATYLPLGKAGREAKGLQEQQDRNVAALSPAAAALRAEAKAGALYGSRWDLVAAVESGEVEVGTVPAADLPEALRSMSASQRAEYLRGVAAERERIRGQISDLASQRRRYLNEQGKAAAGNAGLSDLMLKQIRP